MYAAASIVVVVCWCVMATAAAPMNWATEETVDDECFVQKPYNSITGSTVQWRSNYVTRTECIQECKHALERHSFDCLSAQYSFGTCYLFTDSQATNPTDYIKSDETMMAYYENVCVDTTAHRTDKCFVKINDHFLMAAAVTTWSKPTHSLLACKQTCAELSDPAGAPLCRSFNYYRQTRQCVINEESRVTAPDQFYQENEGVDYYENTCFGSVVDFRKRV